MALAHLSIGTATNRLDLLNTAGYHIGDWRPAAEQPEDVFAVSAMADYRQLSSYRELTAIETMPLTVRGSSQDACVRLTQELRRILMLARDYWTTPYQVDPVYLEARASCETNTRYAIIHAGNLPDDSNPFGEPFLQRGRRSVMEQVLILERGPWCDTAPGDATVCLPVSGLSASGYPFYLTFEDTGYVRIAAAAALIANLPAADFTAEAWIRADGYGGANEGRIFDKCDSSIPTSGWSFAVKSTGGLLARAQFAVTDAYTLTGLDDFTADGEWHHVVAAFDLVGATNNTFYIAVDGVWAATYSTQTPGAGAYQVDAANITNIGNSIDRNRAFDGGIGWTRLSTGLRYAIGVNFTPPSRCFFPDTDATTEGLWIREGEGVVAYDYSGNGYNGTIDAASWADNDCEMGREATCLDEVYVANKHNYSQLTNIHYWDASTTTWSANLIAAPSGTAILPAVPAVGDFVAFGTNMVMADSGPFCSLVFDLLAAGNNLTIEWRYGTAASVDPDLWPVIPAPILDNTNGFANTGVNSVHWEQPSLWNTRNPDPTGADALGVTGWWVVAYVTGIGAGPTAPTQQNRAIYTILSPYVTIDGDVVEGDIPAWLKINMTVRSSPSGTTLTAHTLYMGLRQVSRGANFSAYLNFADEQNPTGVLAQVYAPAAFAASVISPTGRVVSYLPAGAGDAPIALFSLNPAAPWLGRYHVFIRAMQTAGAVGDLQLRVRANYMNSQIDVTPWVSFSSLSITDAWLDMGELSLTPRIWGNTTGIALNIDVRTAVVRTLTLYDMVLLPVDEWVAQITLASPTLLSFPDGTFQLDGISAPNQGTIGQLVGLTLAGTMAVADLSELRINRDAPIAVPRSDQRLWFHAVTFEPPATDLRSEHEFAMSAQLFRQQRYLSMRGDR